MCPAWGSGSGKEYWVVLWRPGHIAAVPLPEHDPRYGTGGPHGRIWKPSATGAL